MSLMRNSLIASGAIFACRLTGMAREIVYTSLFGATGVLDAFYTAFRIPNLLRDLFAEGPSHPTPVWPPRRGRQRGTPRPGN